jgi:hypothetical protein
LNRLVDTIRPESDTGRRFSALVQEFLDRRATAQDAASIRTSLLAWRDNDERLQLLLAKNPSLSEVAPVSQSLRTVADAGLQALDYLSGGAQPPADWRAQQLEMLKQAEQAQAEMLNTIAPAVQKLVEATPAAGPGAGGAETPKPFL